MLKQRNRPTTPSKYSDNNNTATTPAPAASAAAGAMSAKRSPGDRKSPRSSANSITRTVPPLGPKVSTVHWSREVREVTVVTSHDGIFNFRIVGGSDNGEFPVIAEVLPPDTRGVEYRSGAEITTQVTVRVLLLRQIIVVVFL